ncbi:hypothetical protein ACJRO7_001522 [Eucalyptus globulus]|uniref:Uncharacterized protein n=1 Tax=Eucalyptus globulus TaxID=34317 RepID=A0ABD3LRD3_EUCGL
MAKISFAQLFVAALVFSAVFSWPHAEAERTCGEGIEFRACANQACVVKC